MQFTSAFLFTLSLVSAAALPVVEMEAVEPTFKPAALIFARATEACVPICSVPVDIGAAACGTCGQTAPCRHYACEDGNRQVCGVNKVACYYST